MWICASLRFDRWLDNAAEEGTLEKAELEQGWAHCMPPLPRAATLSFHDRKRLARHASQAACIFMCADVCRSTQ